MKITYHAGRTIREHRGTAGQLAFEVTGADHSFTLKGSLYGSPGPVCLIVGEVMDFVTAAHRFGDTFDIDYVKKWIDTEDEARALMVKPAGPIGITCTTCNAGPGKPCTRATDMSRRPVTWFHAAREDGLSWA